MDKSLLKKATSNDPTPVQGHLFDDIARMTLKSVEECQKVEDWLLQRLDKEQSPYIKWKTLRIIRHLCAKGHVEFQRDLQKKSESIRMASSFRGERDPLHGDSINQQVRDSAAEALQFIYDTNLHASYNIRTTGFGSDSMSSLGSEPEKKGFGSKMASLGESITSVGDTLKDKFKITLSKDSSSATGRPLSEQYDEPSRGGFMPPSMPGFGSDGSRSGGSSFVPTLSAAPSVMQANAGHIPSAYYNPTAQHQSAPSVTPAYTPAAPVATTTTTAHYQPTPGSLAFGSHPSHPPVHVAHGATDVQAGDLERRLVEEITTTGGGRTAPSREELKQFCTRVAHLDEAAIAALLDSKLSAVQWQVRVRALHVIEALIQGKHEPVVRYFTERANRIEEQSSSAQSSVTERAKKVLRLIKPGVSGHAEEASLIDTITPTATTTAPSATAASVGQTADLFSGMSIAKQTIAAATAATPVQQPASLDDIFGAPSPPIAPASTADSGAFSFLNSTAAPVQQPPATLNTGVISTPPTTATSSSGFSFIQSGGSPPFAPAPAPISAPATATPAHPHPRPLPSTVPQHVAPMGGMMAPTMVPMMMPMGGGMAMMGYPQPGMVYYAPAHGMPMAAPTPGYPYMPAAPMTTLPMGPRAAHKPPAPATAAPTAPSGFGFVSTQTTNNDAFSFVNEQLKR